jgi:hypothetical protein
MSVSVASQQIGTAAAHAAVAAVVGHARKRRGRLVLFGVGCPSWRAGTESPESVR